MRQTLRLTDAPTIREMVDRIVFQRFKDVVSLPFIRSLRTCKELDVVLHLPTVINRVQSLYAEFSQLMMRNVKIDGDCDNNPTDVHRRSAFNTGES